MRYLTWYTQCLVYTRLVCVPILIRKTYHCQVASSVSCSAENSSKMQSTFSQPSDVSSVGQPGSTFSQPSAVPQETRITQIQSVPNLVDQQRILYPGFSRTGAIVSSPTKQAIIPREAGFGCIAKKQLDQLSNSANQHREMKTNEEHKQMLASTQTSRYFYILLMLFIWRPFLVSSVKVC